MFSISDKWYSIKFFNLTLYGHSNEYSDSGLYEEMEQYASSKIDAIAEALDVDIPPNLKANLGIKVLIIIGQVIAGASFLALALTIWCLIPWETGLHIRQTLLNGCQQIWTSICDRIRRCLQRYEPVNPNENQ